MGQFLYMYFLICWQPTQKTEQHLKNHNVEQVLTPPPETTETILRENDPNVSVRAVAGARVTSSEATLGSWLQLHIEVHFDEERCDPDIKPCLCLRL